MWGRSNNNQAQLKESVHKKCEQEREERVKEEVEEKKNTRMQRVRIKILILTLCVTMFAASENRTLHLFVWARQFENSSNSESIELW